MHPSPGIKPYTLPEVLTNEIPSFGHYGEVWFVPKLSRLPFSKFQKFKNPKSFRNRISYAA